VNFPTLHLKWIGGTLDAENHVGDICNLRATGLGVPLQPETTAPPVCDSLSPTVVEHGSTTSHPVVWLEVTLTNLTPTRCRLTSAPTSLIQTGTGDIGVEVNPFVAPPHPLGDGVAEPGESFWLGISLDGCNLNSASQALMLSWGTHASRVESPGTCSGVIQVSRLGFATPHSDHATTECTPHQFTAQLAEGEGMMNNHRSYIRLTRIGTGPCRTPQHAVTDLVAGTQRSHVPATTRLDDYQGILDLAPTALYPGDRADYVLVWACANGAPSGVNEAIVTWAGAELSAPSPSAAGAEICEEYARVSPLVNPPPTDQGP
jgi:hypothetical protein